MEYYVCRIFLKYSKQRRITKKKNISFLSSNAITTIFRLDKKFQTLPISGVKKFFEKIIQSKDCTQNLSVFEKK